VAFFSKPPHFGLVRCAAGLQVNNFAEPRSRKLKSIAQPFHSCPARHAFELRPIRNAHRIIYGPAGKRALRQRLVEIAEMGRRPNPPLDKMKAAALDAVAMIKKLNGDLARLHDLVLKLNAK
jgi:hypothetical protein